MVNVTGITIKLDRASKALLTRDIKGQGGFQTLMRNLQANIKGLNLTVTPQQMVRIYKYVHRTGQGGFQGRMLPLTAMVDQFRDLCVEVYSDDRGK